MLENPWVPDEIKAGLFPKQVEFLCFEGREALYGGAAGGGKSVAILAAALQFVEQPGYSALIIRRTHKQLDKADSILNKSKDWLWGKAKWNGDAKRWTFPSGATLEFGHMEAEQDKRNYQGGAWAYVGVDEATQFTGPMLAYPRTRQRRVAGSAVPVRWRGASNPGDVGHEYVKARYVKLADGSSPCGPDRQFFPARLEDNPHLDREEYVKTLIDSGIDGLLLAQLLGGDWDAVAGGQFKREYLRHTYGRHGAGFRIGPHWSTKIWAWDQVRRFQTIDPAASAEETAKGEDPDWTVISTWGITPHRELLWLDCVRVRREIPDIPSVALEAWDRWAPQFADVEAVASNRGVYQLLRRTRMVVNAVTPGGKDKLVNATAAIALASDGRLYLPEPALGCVWVEPAVAELVRFTGDPKRDAHDDVVDTVSMAARRLTQKDDEKRQGFAPYVQGQGEG